MSLYFSIKNRITPIIMTISIKSNPAIVFLWLSSGELFAFIFFKSNLYTKASLINNPKKVKNKVYHFYLRICYLLEYDIWSKMSDVEKLQSLTFHFIQPKTSKFSLTKSSPHSYSYTTYFPIQNLIFLLLMVLSGVLRCTKVVHFQHTTTYYFVRF